MEELLDFSFNFLANMLSQIKKNVLPQIVKKKNIEFVTKYSLIKIFLAKND